MTENKPTPSCPLCGGSTNLVHRPFRLRRGEKVLAIEQLAFECASGCVDLETGEEPFRFTDASIGYMNDEQVRVAWREKFGEEIPPPQRPGRKPDEPRRVRVPVMLTPSEAEELDRRRGRVSRSEYLRRAIGATRSGTIERA